MKPETTYNALASAPPIGTSLRTVKGNPMARWYCAIYMSQVSRWEAHTDFYLDIERGLTIANFR